MLSCFKNKIFLVKEQLDELLVVMLAKNVSDAHIEPMRENFRIRLRLDGLLHEAAVLTKEQGQAIISRIKILAQCDIAEQRMPQDGRLYYDKFNEADVRISTCPTVFGEKLVLRNLKTLAKPLAIDMLGMHSVQQTLFSQAIWQPQGLILVTGPTGSGKTVTLYSALQALNQVEKNIVSIEDPVEIKLAGINQINIHPKIGLDFAKSLRAILRQDPDIIMLGEIRDRETAEIAVAAAQTGHLVLSSVHTNNALESIVRLQQMGIAPYQLASTLLLVVAQRLVRVCCTFCVYGCPECYQGYRGRTGIYECLSVSSTIRQMILNRALQDIPGELQRTHWLSLFDHAHDKIANKITRAEEIQRVLGVAC
jgi:type IV pilus assembly protein PilB